MKINDVEKQLGISKANIRFYEKEGLLTPDRAENGYRDYSEADLARLKEIIILRKLGFPVQQIEDILDGALPLQEALDRNILSLQAELSKLNGSLALCQQLKAESVQTLDTERYWEIIHNQEQSGFQFQSLVDDYLKFTEIGYTWLLWPLPIESLRNPWKVGIYFLILSALYAVLALTINGANFLLTFAKQLFMWLCSLAIWTAIFIPLFFLSKKKPKLADRMMKVFIIAAVIAVLLLLFWAILSPVLP